MLANNFFLQLLVICLFSGSFFIVSPVLANSQVSAEESANNRSEVLSSFVGKQRGELMESFDERRDQHKFLFYMGAALLVFVLLTAGFGVSMAMLGKEVFVPHMICAGITVFLSVAHAIVAVVWFFPFK